MEIAAKIVEHGADFMLALKGNQPNLEQETEVYFRDAPAEELVTKTTVPRVKPEGMRERSRTHRDADLHGLAKGRLARSGQELSGTAPFQEYQDTCKGRE